MILTFVFAKALALSKARIAAKSLEAMKRSCIVELTEANVRLQAELDEAHERIAKAEGHENILKSNYGSLCIDYENLEAILAKL
jgi:hypothetical protein